MKVLFLGVLAYLSIVDIKKQRIPVAVCALMGLVVFLWMIFGRSEVSVAESLKGAGLGAVLILAGAATRQAIGIGDGIVFMLCGLILGFWENVCLLAGSLGLNLLFAAGLVAAKKIKGKDVGMGEIMKTRMPFVPFILVMYFLIIV